MKILIAAADVAATMALVPAAAGAQERIDDGLMGAGAGALQMADTLEHHVRQLAETLADPDRARAAIDAFLLAFVRPNGLDRPATPILADAIEVLAGGGDRDRARLAPLAGLSR